MITQDIKSDYIRESRTEDLPRKREFVREWRLTLADLGGQWPSALFTPNTRLYIPINPGKCFVLARLLIKHRYHEFLTLNYDYKSNNIGYKQNILKAYFWNRFSCA